MQPLDNDMDDLFREAAENYPLRVSGADWNKVQAALSEKNSLIPAQEKKRTKNWLWLLLFLLIPFVCNQMQVEKNNENISANMQLAATKINADDQAAAASQTAFVTNTKANESITTQNNNDNKNTLTVEKKKNDKDAATINNANNIQADKLRVTTAGKRKIKVTSGTVADINPTSSGNIIMDADDNPATEIFSIKRSATPVAVQLITKNKVPGKLSASVIDINIEKAKKEKEKIVASKNTRLYVNLLFGKDASRVKSESIAHLGLSAGISLGYNISKHFAIEAGALYSKKYYNSDIKYFNNTKTMWPSNRIITDLEGVCQMIELPVAVRYNFLLKKRSSFFVTAGLSSYLMKKEDYEYNYTTNMNPYQSEVYKTYKNSGNNWLSVLQVTAGWKKKLNKVISLRVQPYYNVPLKGIGIGKLPISGAGIQAGISFDIK